MRLNIYLLHNRVDDVVEVYNRRGELEQEVRRQDEQHLYDALLDVIHGTTVTQQVHGRMGVEGGRART